MLSILSIFLFEMFFVMDSGSSAYPKKIKVALSERKPFVILDSNGGSPKGLGVSIVDNFARNSNLQIDYLMTNSTESYISANDFPIQSLFE